MAFEITCDEKDIEDYLYDNLESVLGLKPIARQYNVGGQFIDILAKSPKMGIYYCIEIKKGNLDAKAYAQAIKYCRLMAQNKDEKNKRIFYPILIGCSLSSDLFYNVNYFYEPEYECPSFCGYRIFDFCPNKGVGFDFRSEEHEKCEINPYDHFLSSVEENEYLKWRIQND